LRVEGRWVKDAGGNTVVLHGATLPTVAEMTASDRSPEERLRALADAGARIVRLPIDDDEITPTFIPATVSPLIDQANALGMLVVLAFRNEAADTVNNQADGAEDFLRLALTYLRKSPGVWLEPFATPVDSSKWQEIAQRMVDVARGYRADAILVINNPNWLTDPEVATGLIGSNIVYAVPSLDGWPLDAAPFIVSPFDGASADADAERIQAAQVWSIAKEGETYPDLWRSSQMCR
jgi:hypothetical protein